MKKPDRPTQYDADRLMMIFIGAVGFLATVLYVLIGPNIPMFSVDSLLAVFVMLVCLLSLLYGLQPTFNKKNHE